MFLVCEPIAWGIEHVPFNAGLLNTIRTAFPEKKIRFLGEATHCEEVRAQIGSELDTSIEWVPIAVPPRQADFYPRLPATMRLVAAMIRQVKDDPSCRVLTFTSGNAALLWTLKLHLSMLHKGIKAQVVLHGDFSTLRYRSSLKKHLNPFFRLGSFRTAVRFACDRRAQYVVLEEAVRDAVVAKFAHLADRFIVLELPLPGDGRSASPLALTTPVRFGYLGRAYATKGFFTYLDVAVEVSRRRPGQAEFHFVGSLTEAQQSQNIPNIDILTGRPSTVPLSRHEFLVGLESLHFACLFYDETYEFTASAVLLDCVEHGKPIVGTRRSIFVNLEERFADLGYLCDTDEYADVVESIVVALDDDRYQRQVGTMNMVKASRSADVLAERYRAYVDALLTKA